jgi:outer membrane protein TolC
MKKTALVILLGSILALGAEPLSLNDCVKLAMTKNQDLKISDKQLQSAQEGIRASYSDVLPSIGFKYSATRFMAGEGERLYQGDYITTPDTSTNNFNTSFQWIR